MSSEGRHLGEQCRHRVGWVFVAPRRNVRPSPPSKMDWFVNAKMLKNEACPHRGRWGGRTEKASRLRSLTALAQTPDKKKGEEKPLHHDPLQMLAL